MSSLAYLYFTWKRKYRLWVPCILKSFSSAIQMAKAYSYWDPEGRNGIQLQVDGKIISDPTEVARFLTTITSP